MSAENSYEAPLEVETPPDLPSSEPDPSHGIVIEKFIALAIVATLFVALIAALPRILF